MNIIRSWIPSFSGMLSSNNTSSATPSPAALTSVAVVQMKQSNDTAASTSSGIPLSRSISPIPSTSASRIPTPLPLPITGVSLNTSESKHVGNVSSTLSSSPLRQESSSQSVMQTAFNSATGQRDYSTIVNFPIRGSAIGHELLCETVPLLHVPLSTSIKQLKLMIYGFLSNNREYEFSADRIVLRFAGKECQNERLLGDYGIEDQHLANDLRFEIPKPSSKGTDRTVSMKEYIQGTVVNLRNVLPSTTIEELKYKIQSALLTQNDQYIKIKDIRLNNIYLDESTVADHPIFNQNECLNILFFSKAPEPLHARNIILKINTGRFLWLANVTKYNSIFELRRRIRWELEKQGKNIPMRYIQIQRAGNNLDNDLSVAHYNLGLDTSEFTVVISSNSSSISEAKGERNISSDSSSSSSTSCTTAPKHYSLWLKRTRGSHVNVEVELDDTVERLKEKVQKTLLAENIHVEKSDIKLMYSGNPLIDDYAAIEDYDLHKAETVHLVLENHL